MGKSLRNGAGKQPAGSQNQLPEPFRAAAGAYAGKSRQELMTELLTMTRQKKAAGELDNAGIDAMVQTILPMLTPEQKQRMEAILGEVKKE